MAGRRDLDDDSDNIPESRERNGLLATDAVRDRSRDEASEKCSRGKQADDGTLADGAELSILTESIQEVLVGKETWYALVFATKMIVVRVRHVPEISPDSYPNMKPPMEATAPRKMEITVIFCLPVVAPLLRFPPLGASRVAPSGAVVLFAFRPGILSPRILGMDTIRCYDPEYSRLACLKTRE